MIGDENPKGVYPITNPKNKKKTKNAIDSDDN
jgi:hypothetical protein